LFRDHGGISLVAKLDHLEQILAFSRRTFLKYAQRGKTVEAKKVLTLTAIARTRPISSRIGSDVSGICAVGLSALK
jgi:hypothetical protein